jgi:very-short-patch-repair endonuclease/predicted transcriptional regulator of viral defense system
MREQVGIDHLITAFADRQHGFVAHGQLVDLGLSTSAIGRRIAAGRLHRRYRGVYAVGHRPTGIEGEWWAAVLAYAPDGVLSHASAAAAFALLRSRELHVTAANGRKRRTGIVIHQRRSVLGDETTELAGMPITTPARTLLDLAASGLNRTRLERAVDSAERQRLLDFADLHELLTRYPRRAGAPALKAVLASYADPLDVRSELETLLLELCDAHRLPRPLVNCVIEAAVRDFCWPSRRLVVEADSYAWHRSPSALNADRERDVVLTLAGWRVLRFTYAQVTRRRRWVAAAILDALSRFVPA